MGSQMNRREFIALVGGMPAWPLAARAQQMPMPVIGFLASASPEKWPRVLAAFRQGLGEAGYNESRNVAIEYRWAEEHYDRLPGLAEDLVQRQVKVLVAPMMAASAAKAATATIPIVFMIPSDPIQAGLVSSLNRPGGNLTGVAYLNVEVAAKRLELLHELVPASTSIALLVNPADPIATEIQTRELQDAARVLGLRLLILNASSQSEIEDAFAALVRERAALQLGVDPLFGSYAEKIIGLAARHLVPTIYPWREFTVRGGLMNYGTTILDVFRQIGVYTGRILNGEKPSIMAVQRPTKFGLVINLKTAKELGLTIPQSILLRADEVIE
jgi:putative tryptophan/tyrosine transport system substrate-binding protein